MANVLNMSGGGKAPVVQSKSVKSTTSQQTVTAPSGVDGYNPITVEPIKLQAKTVVPKRTNEQTVVTSDSRYDGLSQVAVEGVPIQRNKYVYTPFTTEVFYPDAEYNGVYALGVYGCKAIIYDKISTIDNKFNIPAPAANRIYAVHICINYESNYTLPSEVTITEALSLNFGVSAGRVFCKYLNPEGGVGSTYGDSGITPSIENERLIISPSSSLWKFSEEWYYSILAIVA